MSDLLYHEVIPQNDKETGFSSYNNIDFMLSMPQDRALVLKNIRFEGELYVYKTGTTANDNTQVYMDPDVGAHSLINTITSEVDAGAGGIIAENLTEYSRFVKMINVATKKKDFDNNNLSELVQLKAPNAIQTNHFTLENNKLFNSVMDFSLPLMMMLNRPTDSRRVALSNSKIGLVKLSIILSRFENAFFGVGMNSNYNFVIKNARITYQTVLDQPEYKQPISFMSYVPVKQSVSSSQTSVYNKVPAVCKSVTISYQKQSEELKLGENNNKLEKLEVSELQYLFNNSSNSLLTYTLNSTNEILSEAVDSIADTGKDTLTMNLVNSNDTYLQGISFDEVLDLSRTGFTVNMKSNIQSAEPYNMYLYFHSMLEL